MENRFALIITLFIFQQGDDGTTGHYTQYSIKEKDITGKL